MPSYEQEPEYPGTHYNNYGGGMQIQSNYDQRYESNGQNFYLEAQPYPENYWYQDHHQQMPDQYDPQRGDYQYDRPQKAPVQNRYFQMHPNDGSF